MAYATNYTWVFDQIRAKGASAYRLQNENRTVIMAENEGLSPDVVISELQGILPNLSGLVYLTISTKSKVEKSQGGKANDIVIPINLSTSAPVAGIGAVQMPVQDTSQLIAGIEEKFNARLEMQAQQFKHQQEIAELRRQLAEAKEVNPTVAMLQPHLPALISGLFGGGSSPAIAGIPAEPVQQAQPVEVGEDETARATDAINRLLAVDADFINTLCRLAHMAETDSNMYNMAKNMLPPLPQ